MLCIENSEQRCTLRPKVQDEGPVYGAYKATFQTVRHFCASLCCHGWPWQLLLMHVYTYAYTYTYTYSYTYTRVYIYIYIYV